MHLFGLYQSEGACLQSVILYQRHVNCNLPAPPFEVLRVVYIFICLFVIGSGKMNDDARRFKNRKKVFGGLSEFISNDRPEIGIVFFILFQAFGCILIINRIHAFFLN